MTTKPTHGAERAARAVREYIIRQRGRQFTEADQAALAGIIDRSIGLPALVTAVQAVLEFADNGTPVHPGALVVGELRQALQDATGIAGARWPDLVTDDVLPYVHKSKFTSSEIPAYCRADVKDSFGSGTHQCDHKPTVYLAGYGFCKRHAEAIRRGKTAANLAPIMGGETFTRDMVRPWVTPAGLRPDKCHASVADKQGAGRHQCSRKPTVAVGGYGFCERHGKQVVARLVTERTNATAKARVRALMEG